MLTRALSRFPFLAAILAVALLAACDAGETKGSDNDTGAGSTTSASDRTSPETAAPAESAKLGTNDSKSANADTTWTPPTDPKQSHFLGLVADKPVTWIEHPATREMEATRFTVPGRGESNAAEIVVFKNIGGTLEANIERWRGQFRPHDDGTPVNPDISNFTTTGGMEVTLVEILGDWQKMGAASYTNGQLFLMAVVDTGNGLLFIRFVGDEMTVGPNRDAFIQMVKSLRPE